MNLFYINIPAGLLSLFLNGLLVEDPGYLKRGRAFAAPPKPAH